MTRPESEGAVKRLCKMGLHRWRGVGISLGSHHERCTRCGKRRTLGWRSMGGRS